MKALIIRPRKGKNPTYQLVDFTGHDFNTSWGELHKVMGAEFLEMETREKVGFVFDEDRLDKEEYFKWHCHPMHKDVIGPVAIVSMNLGEAPWEDTIAGFDNPEVLHICQEAGYELWPSI